MLPSVFGLEATFYKPLAKKISDDLDASHYLYSVSLRKVSLNL